VIHLLFSTGHTAPSGAALVHADLTEQALHLARTLRDLTPDEREVRGLRALLLVTDARRSTRVDAQGRLVRLGQQDRSRWDRAAIGEGHDLIVDGIRGGRPGRYVLQAAIAALYAQAPTFEQAAGLQVPCHTAEFSGTRVLHWRGMPPMIPLANDTTLPAGGSVRPRRTGVRLVAAGLITAALSGCELPELLAGRSDTQAAAPAAKPAGDNWLVVKQGQRRPEAEEAAPRAADPEPVLEVPELHVPVAPHAVVAEHLDARCVGSLAAGKIAALDVDPGATTAKVSWYHPGDPSVVTYRITSLSQKLVVGRQAELKWQETKPGGEGCRALTATVTGLQRDTPYVFSVDAVRQATWQNSTRATTVARSSVVSTR
jgi:hypothetical protein